MFVALKPWGLGRICTFAGPGSSGLLCTCPLVCAPPPESLWVPPPLASSTGAHCSLAHSKCIPATGPTVSSWLSALLAAEGAQWKLAASAQMSPKCPVGSYVGRLCPCLLPSALGRAWDGGPASCSLPTQSPIGPPTAPSCPQAGIYSQPILQASTK